MRRQCTRMRSNLGGLWDCFVVSLLAMTEGIARRQVIFLVRVHGESMWPEIAAGRRYLASGLGVVRIGDLAVFRNPRETSKIFVKKVAAVRDGAYMMESAVSWGSSSRDFGPVPRRLIIGKIWK